MDDSLSKRPIKEDKGLLCEVSQQNLPEGEETTQTTGIYHTQTVRAPNTQFLVGDINYPPFALSRRRRFGHRAGAKLNCDRDKIHDSDQDEVHDSDRDNDGHITSSENDVAVLGKKSVLTKIKDDERDEVTLPGGHYNARLCVQDNKGNPLSMASTPKELSRKVKDDPILWFNTMYNVLNAIEEGGQELIFRQHQLKAAQSEVQSIRHQAEAEKEWLTNEVTRLRNLRDQNRRRGDHWEDETGKLQLQMMKLQKQVEKLKRATITNQPIDDAQDSDKEVSRMVRIFTPSTSSREHEQSSPLPHGKNREYPDPNPFHGNSEDKQTYTQWKMHLHSKLRISASHFPKQRDRIGYVLDHTRGIAFKTIKTRADPCSNDPYQSVEEVVKDLDGMFEEHEDDMRQTNETKLLDDSFRIGRSETLEGFLARFYELVVPLEYHERTKISHLRRTLTDRLKYQLVGYKPESFHEFVNHTRRIYRDLEQIDEQSKARRGSKGRGKQ